MTDNPLTAAIGQVSALIAEIRERGEAAGEQVSTKLLDGVGEANSRIAETRDNAQARIDETRETAQAKLDEAIAVALSRFEDAREKLSSLPVELPVEIEELKARFSPDELRKVAEAYLAVAAGILTSLSERGEEVVDKLRAQPLVGENLPKLEKVYNDAVTLTEDALGTISGQTRAVGERAAHLAGFGADESPSEEPAAVVDAAPAPVDDAAPAKKAPAKKTPAKKTPAKKAAPAAEGAPAKKTPAKKAPAKKAAAKNAPAKKVAPAKTPAEKAPAEKTPAKTAGKKAPAKKAATKAPAKKSASKASAKKAPGTTA